MSLLITQPVQEVVYPASVAPFGSHSLQAPSALRASVFFACVLLISGCSQEKSGEYQQYSDLPQSSSIPAPATPADSTESPAPSAPTSGTGGNSLPEPGSSPTTTVSESPGQQNTSAALESAAATSDSGSQEFPSGNAATPAIPTEQPPATETSDTPPASENTALTADVSSRPLSNETARSTDSAPSSVLETNNGPGTTPAAAETKSEPPSGDIPDEKPKEPLTIQLLIPEKTFRLEKNSNAIRVTYDDIDLLKILNMEPVPVDAVSHFPAWLKELDGTRIRIRGFMMPTFEATGLKAFTMARDNGICCFVRQPKIYDIIEVVMADGMSSDYIDGKPFDVEGVFRIQPEADETEIYRLYRIENARVLR